jgi:hypothetical protein
LKIPNTKMSWWSGSNGGVVGWLKQRDGAPKLLGSKLIKQAGSNSADWSPKAEP